MHTCHLTTYPIQASSSEVLVACRITPSFVDCTESLAELEQIGTEDSWVDHLDENFWPWTTGPPLDDELLFWVLPQMAQAKM